MDGGNSTLVHILYVISLIRMQDGEVKATVFAINVQQNNNTIFLFIFIRYLYCYLIALHLGGESHQCNVKKRNKQQGQTQNSDQCKWDYAEVLCNTVIRDRCRRIKLSSSLSKGTHKEKWHTCHICSPPVVARLMAPVGRSCEGIIIPRRSVKVDAFLIHKVNHVLTKSLLREHFLQSSVFPQHLQFKKRKSSLFILKERSCLDYFILSFGLKNLLLWFNHHPG